MASPTLSYAHLAMSWSGGSRPYSFPYCAIPLHFKFTQTEPHRPYDYSSELIFVSLSEALRLVGEDAHVMLISAMLHPDSNERPDINEICNEFESAFKPSRTLSSQPLPIPSFRFDSNYHAVRFTTLTLLLHLYLTLTLALPVTLSLTLTFRPPFPSCNPSCSPVSLPYLPRPLPLTLPHHLY